MTNWKPLAMRFSAASGLPLWRPAVTPPRRPMGLRMAWQVKAHAMGRDGRPLRALARPGAAGDQVPQKVW